MYICYDCECEHYKNNEPCIDDITFCEKTMKEHDDKIRKETLDELIKLAKNSSIYGYSIALVDLESIAEQLKEKE